MMQLAFILSFFTFVLPLVSAGLSNTFASALGNSQAIKGSQRNVGPYTLQVLTNETHALVTLNATTKALSSIGWIGVGWGTSMAKSDIVVTWPNADGTWTLSQRTATGQIQPKPITPADGDLIVVPSLSTNASSSAFAAVSFLRPLALTAAKVPALTRASGQMHIFAYSSKNPGSTDPAASIQQHDNNQFGITALDLSVAVAVDNPDAPASTTSTATNAGTDSGVAEATDEVASAPWTRYDSIIVLHAICGGLAWIIFAPLAVLIGRLGRSFQGWLRFHQMIQGILTSLLTIAAFSLGVYAINLQGKGHFMTSHTRLGLVILILIFGQIVLGWYCHHKFDAKRTHRPARNVGHLLLGNAMILSGFVQVAYGLRLYSRKAPGYIWAIYWLVMIATILAYLISLGRLVQSRRGEGMTWARAAFGLGRPGVEMRGAQKLRDEKFDEKSSTRTLSPTPPPVSQLDFMVPPNNDSSPVEPETVSQKAAREWAESAVVFNSMATHDRPQVRSPEPMQIQLPPSQPSVMRQASRGPNNVANATIGYPTHFQTPAQQPRQQPSGAIGPPATHFPRVPLLPNPNLHSGRAGSVNNPFSDAHQAPRGPLPQPPRGIPPANLRPLYLPRQQPAQSQMAQMRPWQDQQARAR